MNGKSIEKISRKGVVEVISFVPVQMEDLFAMPVFETVLIEKADKSKWRTDREDIDKVHCVLEALELSELANRSSN